MKISVAVHGRFHAFELARGLHAQKSLDRLLTTYPAYAVRRVLGADIPLRSAPHLELLRRAGGRLGLSRSASDTLLPMFGKFVARNLATSDADLLVAWSSAALEAIPAARARGMKVVIDRGCTHILHQTDVLQSAYGDCGVAFRATSQRVIDRELEEYELADAITVPSALAARSFAERGIARDKLIVAPLGVDVEQFKPLPPAARRDRPKIVSVGALGVRKGTAALLRAFATIKDRADLHLIGPVDPGFRSVLQKLPLENVTLTGPVPRSGIADIYSSADIFCLPSVEEGFGMVVLEAMASGLPVVISDQVGAADAVTDGKDGYIYPVADGKMLAERLLHLAGDRSHREALGRAARITATGCSHRWEGYLDRVLPAFERLLG